MGILIFKGLTARRLYKSFGVKGLFSAQDGYGSLPNGWPLHHRKRPLLPVVTLFRPNAIASQNSAFWATVIVFGLPSFLIAWDVMILEKLFVTLHVSSFLSLRGTDLNQ
jgi:hypothetical protein